MNDAEHMLDYRERETEKSAREREREGEIWRWSGARRRGNSPSDYAEDNEIIG